MKVPWVFCSYSTTSSVRMMTVRVSPDFNHLSGPIRPLNHSRNQEKTSFFFSNSFLFLSFDDVTKRDSMEERGGAPRLDATRCYSPWPAVTRRDSTRLAIERKSTWKSNSPTSSSFFSFFSFFSSFSSSWADPEIRFHLRFHFQQVFPCHFSLLFWREKNAFCLSPVSVFNCACLPSFLAPTRLPGSCAQIEHKQIDFFYRQWEGTTMLDFLFLILCFIYSLFILYDIIKYLKLYLIFNLYFILYFILLDDDDLSIYHREKPSRGDNNIYINLYIYCHHLKFSSIQFYACFYPFYPFYPSFNKQQGQSHSP